ncbi:conserved hypothetical protein [Uncinocarpus reesii 1704]|uniref:Chromo shadow domain-containing protein n=1 Tax=Uncinocarpus reesii (strain UAMH 1704) TaxID=336963 RepID=C4JGW6_UNCRE|nr:uncharacterized protein UREG_01217 [Uncinocarpus reesii 1704]EEP76368.1 conserved hypothetical protein [Uncinocarpus reesii 1704]
MPLDFSEEESGGESIPFKPDPKEEASNQSEAESDDDAEGVFLDMNSAKTDGAQEALDEYFKIIGGRPEKQTKKRKSVGAASTPETMTSKKAKTLGHSSNGTPNGEEISDWTPKSNNWDRDVRAVETIVREGDNLYALLYWNNDKKIKVSLRQCYEKCPRKMLKFYENHLVFKDE